MTKFKLSTALVLAILLILLIYQNTAPVEIRFLFLTMEMPRAALLTIVMLVGIVIGILISLALSGNLAGKKQGGHPAKGKDFTDTGGRT